MTTLTCLPGLLGAGILPGSDIAYKIVRGSPADDVTITIPGSHAIGGRLFVRLLPTQN